MQAHELAADRRTVLKCKKPLLPTAGSIIICFGFETNQSPKNPEKSLYFFIKN